MKIKKILFILFLLLTISYTTACNKDENTENGIKVVFELEGGIYKNCTTPITYYYDYEDENTNLLIKEPYELTKTEIKRAGYTFVGWFKTKVTNGDDVSYADEWNFETDKVSTDGITLYASWKKNTKFTYEVCYYDVSDKVVVIGTYEVDEDEKFSDYNNYAKKRINYTAIGFKDAEGNAWNNDYTHPGGDDDLCIRVFVEYIEGTYSVVTTKEELVKNKNKNIYLMADIDMEGDSFNFTNYTGTFLGNNHTISNISINYDARTLITDFNDENEKCLCISLFGNTTNATIKDVKFNNVTVDIVTLYSLTNKIYVAPISVSMTNTIISNVEFSGEFKYSQLPNNFDSENDLIYVINEAYYLKDEASVITDFVVDINLD